ncbi:MAG: tetratricopeptide repeat protein [Myxococcota bacterium]
MTLLRAASCAVAAAALLGACRDAPADDGPASPATPGPGAADAAPSSATEERRRPAEPESRHRDAIGDEELSAYRRAMIEGDAALFSGLFEEARRHYLHAMELRPGKTSPALGALRTMALRGHGEERAAVEQRIRRKVDSYRARPETEGAADLLEARMAIALQRPGEALDKARLAVQRLPDLGVAWRVLGEAEQVNEHWGEAVEAFRKAADLGLAARSGTWERMADALDELGDLEAAEEAARKAVDLTGEDPNAKRRRLNLLGAVVKHRGRLGDAAEILDRAKALGPDDPAVQHNLGTLAEARGDLEEALEHYDRALEAGPVPMTSWRRGHALLKLDRRQEALESFVQAAAHMDRWTWPRSTRWWPAYEIGRLYARASRHEEAAGWFEDAMREARSPPSLREVRSWLAFVRSQGGADDEE